MIQTYSTAQSLLRADDMSRGLDLGAIWIDLLDPESEAVRQLDARFRIKIPDRADMEEIEISSRLYRENGAAFMTAILPASTDDDEPEMAPVSFILCGEQLITVRYHDPRAFTTFPTQAQRPSSHSLGAAEPVDQTFPNFQSGPINWGCSIFGILGAHFVY